MTCETDMTKLTLISFPTCPFVQRAVITLKEKGVDFDVVYIDLADKPDWFLEISPLGKVPVLKVEREGYEPAVVFESAVIVEYLEETAPGRKIHPEDPLERARHRTWVEFGSQMLGDLWRFYSAKSEAELTPARDALRSKLERLENTIAGPLFSGEALSYVDVAFAPLFRQIDVINGVVPTGLTDGLEKVEAWGRALSARESVKQAAPSDFAERFLERMRANDAQVLKTN